MRNAIVGIVLACLLGTAHAQITERLVVLLGVKLPAAKAKLAHARGQELAKRGIELFDDPSATQDPQPAITTYAGRVLSSRAVERNKPQSVALAAPTADDVAKAKQLLAANDLPDDVELVALVVYSGGK
jgi:hypothetical protein